MKHVYQKHLALSLAFAFLLAGCSTSRQNSTSDTYNQFKQWVSNTSSSAADKTEEQWKDLKTEYHQFTDKLDQEEDQWSEELKAEYKDLKQNYKQLEANAEQKWKQAKDDDPEAKATGPVTTESLLGKYAKTEQLTAAELPQAYQEFMQNLRRNMGSYTNQQWDEADRVYQQLERRRDQVNLSTSDLARIRTWQAEYHSLRTAHRKL